MSQDTAAAVGIKERLHQQETQSQKVFVIVQWIIFVLLAVLLYRLDPAGAVRWVLLQSVISIVPTVMMLRKANPRTLSFVLPVALATSLCSVTFLVQGGYPFWVLMFAAISMSIATRDSRAPVPVLILVLGTIAYQYFFGTGEVQAEIGRGFDLSLYLTLLAGLLLFLVTRRMEKIHVILRDATSQEETFRRLDEALERMRLAGAQVSGAAASLGSAARGSAGQVEDVLAPAVAALAESERRLQEVQQGTTSGVAHLRLAIDQSVQAMTEQAQKVSEASVLATAMAESTNSAAADAAQVAEAAVQSHRLAADGNRVTAQVLTGVAGLRQSLDEATAQMNSLSERSRQISQVVSAIRGITEQTNMLALNAAIEAARAGEKGRGFAVVADEVRKLSQHSAHAAQEIASLIAAVQEDTHRAASAVEAGAADARRAADQTGEVGRALERILDSATQTADVSQGIAARTREAADGARQLSLLVDALAAIAEESSAAAEEMSAVSTEVVGQSQAAARATEVVSKATQQVTRATDQLRARVEETSAEAARLRLLAAELQAK